MPSLKIWDETTGEWIKASGTGADGASAYEVAVANGFIGDEAAWLLSLKGADGGTTNPMTTAGDIIIGGTSGTPTRLAKGTDGQVLTLAGGAPSWAAGGVGGTLSIQKTTVALSQGQSTNITAQLILSAFIRASALIETNMTANTSNGFVASTTAGTVWGQPYLAFNGSLTQLTDSSDAWSIQGVAALLLKMPEVHVVDTYEIYAGYNQAGEERAPKSWVLYGSADNGATWTALDSRSNQSFAATTEIKSFVVSNPGEYDYYKLDVTASTSASIKDILIGQLRFYEVPEINPVITLLQDYVVTKETITTDSETQTFTYTGSGTREVTIYYI